MKFSVIHLIFMSAASASISSTPFHEFHKRNATSDTSKCRRTKVAILGAGTAGITAGQALSNASVTDFLIVEYNSDIGGRVAHADFGKKPDGSSYVIELGANWIQGIESPGGPVNPIWTLAEVYNLTNTYSNYSSLETFTEKGADDYTNLIDTFSNAYSIVEQDAGYMLNRNLQDRSFRSGLRLANWKPLEDPKADAIEWWQFDFEYSYTPDLSSQEWAIVNYNTTFYTYSEGNNFVYDLRGFNAFIKGQASTFLKKNDSRLLLNTIVTNISYTDNGVTIYNKDGSCIQAEYAICTFSLGVLQNDAISFSPALPSWKQLGIETFDMATYTKIFLQFPPDQVFWNTSTQFFLYADPAQRGYYPVFQSLDSPGFLPGSGILFVTVTQDESNRVERQSDAVTKAEVLAVLRLMFGSEIVPDPIAFLYPRWTLEPWAYGSYSNWPPGTTLEMHQNLRANVGRLHFAGEATSTELYGFLHGAWFEGRNKANQIAACLGAKANATCMEEDMHYDVLYGTSPLKDYSPVNGWLFPSNLTYGDL